MDLDATKFLCIAFEAYDTNLGLILFRKVNMARKSYKNKTTEGYMFLFHQSLYTLIQILEEIIHETSQVNIEDTQ